MNSEEAKATTQNIELVDINYPPPAAALKMACERTLFKVSGLDKLKNADKAFLTKMTDLEIDLSESVVNSQDID